MPLYRAFLQTLGAVVLLALTLACHGKSGSGQPAGTAIITGTVTYARVPLAKDAQGLPTGLVDASIATNLQTLPARGISVRFYQHLPQTNPDGSTTLVWYLAQEVLTDVNGYYAVTLAYNTQTMVEVLSTFDGGNGNHIRLVAEPQGINSATPAIDRLQYALRKAADGTAPAGNNVPNSLLSVNCTVDFAVGLNDAWWVTDPVVVQSNKLTPLVDQAVLETTLPGRTAGSGTGSRVLGIGDTVASFLLNYGVATPGTTLDLHYWPGRSESRGSYIEYDQSQFPQALDASTLRFHFFGSLRGGPANDDAWDEGVILPLLARSVLFAGNNNRTFTIPMNPLFPQAAALPNLSPDMARIEGLAEAMAANVLKSPYLADTQGTTLAAPVRDIRDISSLSAAQKSPFSAPALRAFAWEIILKANSLPSPGTSTNWDTINPLAAARFFLTPTGGTNTDTNITALDSEPINIFSQLVRLSEGQSAAEPVNLAAVLPDAVVAALGAPFGISWPRPTSGPNASFAVYWGPDPVTPLPSVALSMAKAIQVNGSYPNYSQGEVFYAGFSLNADKRCILSAALSPALAAGAQVDVDLPLINRTFSFTGTGGSTPVIVIPVAGATPYYHPVRLRLKSPATLQPDVTVTLSLTPVP
jgi:hypothetical protein